MKKTFFYILAFCSLISCNSPSSNQHQESCTLIMNVDTNCILYIDGTSHGVFKNGDIKKVNVDKGEHLIITKNLDSSKVLLSQKIEINDIANKVIDLKMTGIKVPVAGIDTLKLKVNARTNNNTNVTQAMVKIGKQIWMAKNLNENKYANGDAIPEAKTAEQWIKYGEDKKGCWCYYENKSANGNKYGKLYNWYAVDDSRGLAPKGWHIPSDAEWTTLTDKLGGENAAGTKMKSSIGWNDYNGKSGNGTNTSGFAGLPGGYRFYDGTFSDICSNGSWWSSTEYGTEDDAWLRLLLFRHGIVLNSSGDKPNGLSVRCLRD